MDQINNNMDDAGNSRSSIQPYGISEAYRYFILELYKPIDELWGTNCISFGDFEIRRSFAFGEEDFTVFKSPEKYKDIRDSIVGFCETPDEVFSIINQYILKVTNQGVLPIK